MEDYTARLENREVMKSGHISYDLIVIEDSTEEELINTDFTVEPRQEERDDFEDMVGRVAKKKVRALKGKDGKDHSGKEISL